MGMLHKMCSSLLVFYFENHLDLIITNEGFFITQNHKLIIEQEEMKKDIKNSFFNVR